MIDTHTHIYMREFENEGSEAVERALGAGVGMMVLPGVDEESARRMKRLHELCPADTVLSLGLHPTELGEDWEEKLLKIEKELEGCEIKAIGETGMDLYWDATFEQRQREAFSRHIDMAVERGDGSPLPVIIHCREALGPVLEVIADRKNFYGEEKLPPLIFHSFTGSREDVERIRAICDPWFGINGVVTFKNAATLREALPEIGIDRIILETDSPYLAPVPKRGRRNESSYLPFIRDKVAETLDLAPGEVERITDNNARKIFNI